MTPSEGNEQPFSGLLASLPFPLALVASEYLRESNPFIKLHRLTDAAETLTRFATMILLSDVLRQHGRFPEGLRKVLSKRIERPTFGAWEGLCRQACNSLPTRKGRIDCFVAELPAYVRDELLPSLGSGGGEPFRGIIDLRNFLAHGGRLPDALARDLLRQHQAPFETLLGGLAFLGGYLLMTRTADDRTLLLRGLPDADGHFPEHVLGESGLLPEPEHIMLVHKSETLDLFPLHAFGEVFQWREGRITGGGGEAAQLYFRLNSKGYLEFTALSDNAAFSQHRGEALERFRELYKIEEWRRLAEAEREAGGRTFDELVRELTEVFVGRDRHLREAKNRLREKGTGILYLSGDPGVGKSALMARLCRDFRNAPQKYLVIPYFFRLGHPGCSTEQFLRAALAALCAELQEAVDLSPNPAERHRQFVHAVERVGSERGSPTGKTVLFLIDGLDEIHRLDTSFVRLLFTPRAPRVLWLCSGRRDPELDQALRTGGAEWIFSDGLPALDEAAVHGMLTTHLERMKYELFARDEKNGETYCNRFVDVVASKSRGLPLYVHMVIEDLREGRCSLADEDKLPEGLEAYYERILERLKVDSAGSVLTSIFALLAWAKEPVTEAILKVLLSEHHLSRGPRWDETFARAMAYGHLMLRASETSDGEPAWTFYHESFRDYLLEAERIAPDLEWAQTAWLRWCSQWSSLKEADLRHYALRNYAEHLRDGRRCDELFALARDDSFRRAQGQAFPDEPDLPLQSIRLGLEMAAQTDDAANMAEFLLSHARLIAEIQRESPLDGFRRVSLQRAWELSDLLPPEHCVLWHLLLTWELADIERHEDARATLRRLLQRQLPVLSPDFGRYAAYLLLYVHAISNAALESLAENLLNDQDRLALCRGLATTGCFPAAKRVGLRMSVPEFRTRALREIAEAEIMVGSRAAAQQTLASAVATSKHTEGRVAYELGEQEDTGLTGDTLATTVAGSDDTRYWNKWLRPGGYGARLGVGLFDSGSFMSTHVDHMDEVMVQAEAGAFRSALKTAKSMDNLWEFAAALVGIAQVQARSGAEGEARETLDGLIGSVKVAARWAGSAGYIAVAHADAGEIAAAIEMAMGIEDPGQRQLALRLVGVVLAVGRGKRLTREAIAKAVTILTTPQDEALEVADLLASTGKAAAARDTLATAIDALASTDASSVITSLVEALRQVALAQVGKGKEEEARETLASAARLARSIPAPAHRAVALGQLGVEQREAQDEEAAQATLAEAKDTAMTLQQTPEWWLGADALCTIAVAEARAGHVASAIETASHIEGRGRRMVLALLARIQTAMGDLPAAIQTATGIGHAETRAVELSRISVAQVSTGDADGARYTLALAMSHAKQIKNQVDRWSALKELVEAQLTTGEITNAMRAANEIEDDAYRSRALASIAGAQAKKLGNETAQGTFAVAVLTARKAEDPWSRALALGEVAVAQIGAGEIEEGSRSMAEAVAAVEEIDDWRDHNQALAWLAQAQAESGNFAGGIQTALRIRKTEDRDWALGKIATAQLEADDIDGAGKAATCIRDPSESVKVLASIARRQAGAGDMTHAQETFALASMRAEGGDWEYLRSQALACIAKAQIAAGLAWEGTQTARRILINHEQHLPDIAAALVELGDTRGLKELLFLCRHSLNASYKICGMLAKAYPEQASAVGTALRKEVDQLLPRADRD